MTDFLAFSIGFCFVSSSIFNFYNFYVLCRVNKELNEYKK